MAVHLSTVLPKGGVGKTTTAVNLGVELAKREYRVLMVDLDPQGHVARALGVPVTGSQRTIADVLSREASLPQVTVSTGRERLWLAPATTKLASVQRELETQTGGRYALAEALRHDEVMRSYDVIISDTPPTPGVLSICGMYAADYLIAPVQTTRAAAMVPTLYSLMEELRRYMHWGGNLAHVVPTMYHMNQVEDAQVIAALSKYLREQKADIGTMQYTIRASTSVSRAWMMNQAVVEYAPQSEGAKDYSRLAEALVELLPERSLAYATH